MSGQIADAVKSFVIVTQNFVEALDLAEALNAFGPSRVTHFPTCDELLRRLERIACRPDGAFLAEAPGLDRCIGRLADRGTRLVLIDGDGAQAERAGAFVLSRPYGALELGPIISALRAG